MSEDNSKIWDGMEVRLPTSFRLLCEQTQSGSLTAAALGRIVCALILNDDSKLKGTEKAIALVQREELVRMSEYLKRQKALKTEKQRKWRERQKNGVDACRPDETACRPKETACRPDETSCIPEETAGDHKGKGKGNNNSLLLALTGAYAREADRLADEPARQQPPEQVSRPNVTDDFIRMKCHHLNIPADFADTFRREMDAMDWHIEKSNGDVIHVRQSNCAQILLMRWKFAKEEAAKLEAAARLAQNPRKGGGLPDGVVYHQPGYDLSKFGE